MSGADDGNNPRSGTEAPRGLAARDLSGALTERGPETGAALNPGAVFAQRFRIEDRVGSGSFADVYRAKDLKSGRDVALKLIRSDRLVTEAKRQEFVREGVRTQELNSKSIVRVFDITDHEGQPYIVMEWLGDLTLRRWLNHQLDARTPASITVSCNVILALLDGLDEAHARGIVHRDLKPENVILLAPPTEAAVQLRIVDFGISASVRELSEARATGTQDYMPSEQGRGAAPHPTADIYALSVIFYEMLIGGVPRHNTSPAASRPDVPAGVDRLVARGLSDFAGSRPQTVAAYRQELQAAVTAAAAEAEKARLAALEQQRRDALLAEQERIRKEKEAAAAKAKADREAEAARRREAAAAAEAARKARLKDGQSAPAKTDPAKPDPGKISTTDLGELVIGLLSVAASIGFFIGALLVIGRVWLFLTYDFEPTRELACKLGLKSSCPVATKGFPADLLKPTPFPSYTPLFPSTSALEPITPKATPSTPSSPTPTSNGSPSISDWFFTVDTPTPTATPH